MSEFLDKHLLEKANTVFYFLEKEIARDSLTEWLEENDCTVEEWAEIRRFIADKTDIRKSYNNRAGY